MRSLFSISLVIYLSLLPHAFAEPTPTEMVIYGAPYTQPLFDLPQSASVIDGDKEEARGVSNFQNIIDYVPNLSYSGGTSRPRFFLIRGIGELEQYEGAPNPSVATIIDGIDFSGLGVVVPFFDIDQVEVLRGPQATRFGSSALAGAVNVVSNGPAPYSSGKIRLEAGSDELVSGGLAVGGPVDKQGTMQVRIAAYNSQSNGFRNNRYLSRDNTNERDESLARLRLRYLPTADLSFEFSVWHSAFSNGYDAFTIDNDLTTESDQPGRDTLYATAGSLLTEYRSVAEVKLINTLALGRASQTYSFDGDWGNDALWAPYNPYDYFSSSDRKREMFSDELRIVSDASTYKHGESQRYVLGLYVQNLSEKSSTNEFANGDRYDFLASDYDAVTLATFGQYEAPLSHATSLTGGVRVERRDADYDDSRAVHLEPDTTMVGGSLTLAHDISDEHRVYALVSRGFKGGGVNPGLSVPSERRLYDPEYLWSFEVGSKATWLDRKIDTNIGIFHEVRRNAQLKLALQDNPEDPLSFTYLTESTAKGSSTGVELNGRVHVTRRWDITASGAVMDTQYSSVPSELSSLDGRRYSHAPGWQYTLGSELKIWDGLFAAVDVTGKDGFYFDDSHNARGSSYSLLNSSVGWRGASWSFVAWGRNLLSERYAVRGFFFGDEPPDFPNKEYVQLGDPRAFGVTFEYRF